MTRGAICLTCRTALAPGEACDLGPAHKVVRLAEPAERRKALDAVWGPPHLRVRGVAKVTATGGGVGGLFEGCNACDGASFSGEIGAILLVIVIAAFAAIAIWWITTRIAHAVRNHRARLRPQGAVKVAPPKLSAMGKVTSGDATGLQLLHDDAIASAVMLRDGVTDGLRITLDDGTEVMIPAGRVRLDGDGARFDALDLKRFDPEYRADDAHPVIPCGRVERVELAPGDRVELLGPLDSRPDPRGGEVGFRDAAPSILVPAGVPWLRRI